MSNHKFFISLILKELNDNAYVSSDYTTKACYYTVTLGVPHYVLPPEVYSNYCKFKERKLIKAMLCGTI